MPTENNEQETPKDTILYKNISYVIYVEIIHDVLMLQHLITDFIKKVLFTVHEFMPESQYNQVP